MSERDPLRDLLASKYMLLTTYRRDGTPVPTVVWLAEEGGRVYVRTLPEAGKVKRIRHTPRVTMAPCDRTGQHPGTPVAGTARLLTGQDGKAALSRFDRRYGLLSRGFTLMHRLRGNAPALIEITPDEGDGAAGRQGDRVMG